MNGARPDLNLLSRTRRNQLLCLYARGQGFLIEQYPVNAQDVRHEVVREDSQALQVIEAPRSPPSERYPEVRRRELCPLVERHLLPLVVVHVVEVGHLYQQPREPLSGGAGLLDQPPKASVEALDEVPPQVVQRPGEMPHELARERVPRRAPGQTSSRSPPR